MLRETLDGFENGLSMFSYDSILECKEHKLYYGCVK